MYAVEFAHRPGRELINMAKKRTNVIPIIEDARYPLKYRMLVDMVDVVFADVAQPDQARIVGLNSQYFLKNGGHFMISIKASCIDSTQAAEAVFASEINKLKQMDFKPLEYVTLEPFERDHAVVIGSQKTHTETHTHNNNASKHAQRRKPQQLAHIVLLLFLCSVYRPEKSDKKKE